MCQGLLECGYIGVIIGPDVQRDFELGRISEHPGKRSRHDQSVFGEEKATEGLKLVKSGHVEIV